MKKVILISLVFFLAGCGNNWNREIQAITMTGCLRTSNGNTDYCECVLNELMEKYSQKEYESLSDYEFRKEEIRIAKICSQ